MRDRRRHGDDHEPARTPAPEASRTPAGDRRETVLALQRGAGNRAVTAMLAPRPAAPEPRSLAVLRQVRSLARASVQTWGGEFRTRRYRNSKNKAGQDVGVDIEIEFIPNDKVNAKKIGLVQTAMSQSGGSAPFLTDPVTGPERTRRSITKGRYKGLAIDQLYGYINPIYYTEAGSAGDRLGSTPTVPHTEAGGGRHGWRWVDDKGVERKRSALLNDEPALGVANDSTQQFETAAVAIEGPQRGTYYGSVRWGWRRDAKGKFRRIPFRKKSDDVPSWLFNTAARLWNRTKTDAGVQHISLPISVGRWVAAPDAPLLDDPGAATPSELAKLDPSDRVQVTTRGTTAKFNAGRRGGDRYWKVTVVSGTHVGMVGWTLAANLTAKKPPPEPPPVPIPAVDGAPAGAEPQPTP